MTHVHEQAGYYPDYVAGIDTLFKMSEEHRAHKATRGAPRETRDLL